ncbi:hypothetical protein B0H66DRAFT_562735 [Apodospora peruviana]|uniref:Uncharacterized protein n=1 Tax=Apodospora peruviana TaxID=516989 RepID=A0AAE0I229_9PEZI|nr:hypothetical protein B0H66DRAFT_562735 [Apodospora peruviana]
MFPCHGPGPSLVFMDDVSYATSSSLGGPYIKSSRPLLVTGDYGVTAPGGTASVDGGGHLVFHARCESDGLSRCMFQVGWKFENREVLVT